MVIIHKRWVESRLDSSNHVDGCPEKYWAIIQREKIAGRIVTKEVACFDSERDAREECRKLDNLIPIID